MTVAIGFPGLQQIATLEAVSRVVARTPIAYTLLIGLSLGCSPAYFTAALLEMCIRAPRAVCALDVRTAPPFLHRVYDTTTNILLSTDHLI